MRILKRATGDLTTERLRLRPLQADDAAPLFALFDNWNVVRYLSSPPWPYGRSDADRYVLNAIEHAPGFDEDVLAITHDSALIGVIGVRLRAANALQQGPGPTIGYWLGEAFWGHGFMSEAATAFVRTLFDTIDTDVIYSGGFADNTASLRVQTKIGFEPAGTASLFSTPRGAAFPHINTVLTRKGFVSVGKRGRPDVSPNGAPAAGTGCQS